MRKIFFIGSNPSIKSGSVQPFWDDTKSTTTLLKWIDSLENTVDVSIDSIIYLNVYDLPTPGNRPLKTSEIKDALHSLNMKLGKVCPDNKIITLGRAAEKALTMLNREFYAMPHPSGLNRMLNDANYVEEKIKGLRAYLSPFKIESPTELCSHQAGSAQSTK